MEYFLKSGLSRRHFMSSAAAGLAAAATPLNTVFAQPKPRYTRYNATSAKGREMLKSYATAVKNLMSLKPSDPRNWFRNAFIHTMDCPHGNWWFFVWHRGYLGWFEETLRWASGNPDFAIPYWDWTELPRIPADMFGGVLDPSSPPYNPFIKDFDTFYAYLNPALTAYWNRLNAAQLAELKTRMMPTLQSLWQQVKGNSQDGAMFAPTPYARYLTATNPGLDANTRKMVSPEMVRAGLAPIDFYKFNSSVTPSHNTQPGQSTRFGILEGNPHNKVHNNIGGVGHLADPLKFGYMADNLSPVDPVFFLHHSNMDRLWDVWTRKQERIGQPTLPTGRALADFKKEPFLFYIDAKGNPVTKTTAGDYIDIGAFDYGCEPGFGEPAVVASSMAAVSASPVAGRVAGGVGAVTLSDTLEKLHQGGSQPVVVEVTIPHPKTAADPREFDVLVNAPAGTTSVGPDSPYYAGTISFFGFMKNMTGDATFVVPLPAKLQAIKGALNVQVIPHGPPAPKGAPKSLLQMKPASVLKAVAVSAW